MPKPPPNAAEDAYVAIRNAILLEKIRTSQPLRENVLMRDFQFTRTPIREALSQLTHEGLAETTRDYGLCVTQPTVADLCGALMSRMAVESLMVWDLAKKLREDSGFSIGPLADVHKRLEKVSRRKPTDENRIDFLLTDLSFHTTVAELSGHRLAVATVRRTYYFNVISIPGAATVLPAKADGIVEEHRTLLAALRAKDAEKAVKETCRHLVAAAVRWFPYLEDFLVHDVHRILKLLTRENFAKSQVKRS